LLVEIYLALGRYADAERAAQWALDLRPGNPVGYRAAARVREAYGDIPGAIDFIEKTYQRVPELQTTERAELLVDLARLYRLDRRLDTAAANLAAVDARVPGFFAAEAERAELHEALGEWGAAASVWGAHYRHTGALAARYREADARRRAGQEAEAKDAFADFVRQALAAQATPANANLELAEYYAEVAAAPADALRVARLAAAQRDTAAAQATLAWALFLNRDLEAADAALQRALAVNPDQALWRFRAGRIALARNQPELAYAHLEAALALAPRAAFARQARKLLGDLDARITAQ
jgi:tetratricopeptide (TPR) repeat protein